LTFGFQDFHIVLKTRIGTVFELYFSNLRFTLSKAAKGEDINALNNPIENRKSFLILFFPSFIFSIALNLSSCWYCKKSFSSALNVAETRSIFRSA
jgi:hypothetical protein